jgi:anthranilate/para-aminobenzoate synthase component I
MKSSKIDTNQQTVRQILSILDYDQLSEISLFIEILRKDKRENHYKEIEKKSQERRMKRIENERLREQEYYPLVRRFCKEHLQKGDIVKFIGSHHFRQVAEIHANTILGLQVRYYKGEFIATGYASENGFENLQGMIRDKKLIPTKELIKEL